MEHGLFSAISLRDLTLPNRIVVSPMCQYSADEGNAGEWHLMNLGQFATGGAGLVITESAHVQPRGRITRGCLGLYSDDNEHALKRVVDFCRRYGDARLGVQISHAGRKGSTRRPWEGRAEPLPPAEGGWRTVGCSGIPRAKDWPLPLPLDRNGLEEVRQAHADAAARAARIGFDLLELVCSHGYLLHEFLSPLSNHRSDENGGTLENRMRFPLEVFAAVRAVWPAHRPMGVRVSATDWVAGGWSVEETIRFASELRRLGCDYIAVSTGGLALEQEVPVGEGYQVEYAARVRREAGLPTMAMGMLYDPRHAERIVAGGQADFVALARAMLYDPHWAWYAAAELGAEVAYPPQFLRAYKSKWLREMRTRGR